MGQDKRTYVSVFQGRFAGSLGYANLQRTNFLEGFSNSNVVRVLKDQFQISAEIAGDGVSIQSPLGVISVAFVPATDELHFAWAAVFSDQGPDGKSRDLYAVELNWNRPWSDGTVGGLTMDFLTSSATPVTYHEMLQRVLSAKLEASISRIEQIRS